MVGDMAKWVLADQISPEEFVNMLQYLKSKGTLFDNDKSDSFPVNTQSAT